MSVAAALDCKALDLLNTAWVSKKSSMHLHSLLVRCLGGELNKYLSIILPTTPFSLSTASLWRQFKITGMISFFTIANQMIVDTRSLSFFLVEEWIVKMVNIVVTKSDRIETMSVITLTTTDIG